MHKFLYPYTDVSKRDRKHKKLYGPKAEHYIFSFDNGYGASVIRNKVSYGHEDGLYELALLKDGTLATEPLFGGQLVMGYLNLNEVNSTLSAIAALPASH